jgi:hypothetical protein
MYRLAASNVWNPQGLSWPVMVLLYPFLVQCMETSTVVLVKALPLPSLVSNCYDIVNVSFLLISKNEAFIACIHTKTHLQLRAVISVVPYLVTRLLPTCRNICRLLADVIVNKACVIVKSVSSLSACGLTLWTSHGLWYATHFEYHVFLSFYCHSVFARSATRHNTRNIIQFQQRARIAQSV